MTQKEKERQWEIESATNTLLRAAEIQKDKKLMGDINKEMKNRQNELSEILRNLALKINSNK